MNDRYGDIKCPTLIFHSKKDRVSSYENLKFIDSKINPGIKDIVILNKAHHNLFDDNPEVDLIYNKIETFIKSN